MMGEERKIEIEEVTEVAPPPKARVETAGETFERKRDYLAGFLAEKPAEAPVHGPGGDVQATSTISASSTTWRSARMAMPW